MISAKGKEVDKPRFINAAFVWWDEDGNPYALTPLVSEGEVLTKNILINKTHAAMPHFIIYKDFTCAIEICNDIHLRTDVRLAVGGISLYPEVSFAGFLEKNIPGLEAKRARIAIAYNPGTNKVALCSTEDMDIYEFKQRLVELGFTIILGLDSGGSAQWSFENSERLTSRVMAGWLWWEGV